jgi:hypothetical protein
VSLIISGVLKMGIPWLLIQVDLFSWLAKFLGLKLVG